MQYLVTTLATIVLLLSTAPQPDVHFSATWQRPNIARLAWTQPSDTSHACLTRIPASGVAIPLDCYSDIPAGSQVVILLGAIGPLDSLYKPVAGDQYVLTIGDNQYTTALRAILRLPVIVG